MRTSIALLGLLLTSLPALAFGQEYGQEYIERGPRSASVIQTAGHWGNYMSVPDGHCGCPMPVRCDDYTECCRPCGVRPFCFLKRVGRMLDYLLPCNKCCGGGCLIGDCHGCGWFKSRCPKNCSYCDHSPSCGSVCPSCDHGIGPAMSDPFLDDPPLPPSTSASPMPPIPSPSDDTGFRHGPVRAQPYNLSRNRAPHHAAGMNLSTPRNQTPAPIVRPQEAATPRRKAKVANAAPAEGAKAIGESVLRRTSFEAEAAEASHEPARLSQPAAEPINSNLWDGYEVPVNPLR